MNKMKIDIWSDIACPYCYVGKRKLEKALEQFPFRDNVELVWHSYEIDPSLTEADSSTPFYSYITRRLGISEDQSRQSNGKINQMGQEVGINYNFDSIVVANTHKALRMVKLAALDNLATQMEEALFKAYFTDGKNINDNNVLTLLGTDIGLNKDSVSEVLNSEKFSADVQADIEYADNDLKLEFIPFYLFNNKHIVQGSISVDSYVDILKKAYAEWESEGVSSSRNDAIKGKSCSIDGHCSL